MSTDVKALLPKPGWWNQNQPLSLFAEEVARLNGRLQEIQDVAFTHFQWTHNVVVESADVGSPGYFCGQACSVEKVPFFGEQQRLAAWWTGCRSRSNVHYGFIPSSFILVPLLETLGQQVMDVVSGCGYERVARERHRPGRRKFWLELDSQDQCVVVWFNTVRSAHSVHHALLAAGIVFDTCASAGDFVVRPLDNIIR